MTLTKVTSLGFNFFNVESKEKSLTCRAMVEIKLHRQLGALVKRHVLPLIAARTLSTLSSLLVPQFPHLESGDKINFQNLVGKPHCDISKRSHRDRGNSCVCLSL